MSDRWELCHSGFDHQLTAIVEGSAIGICDVKICNSHRIDVIKTEGWALNNWTMESVVSLCVLLLLRVSDLQYDLAGLVWCARKHALRMACLRKRQD
jgi:hypothetical protein